MWLLSKLLKRIIKRGQLTLIDHRGKTRVFGVPDPAMPHVVVRFTDKAAPNFVARNPRLGAGEAYMNGRMVVEQGDIRDLLTIFRGNGRWEDGNNGLKAKGVLRQALGYVQGRVDRLNWQLRSRRNVAHHYDLDDRLYSLFLDTDRQYSCGYFATGKETLDEAQSSKLAHIAAKLHLAPGQRVLDIGCGWGGMALFLNRVADVDVLGITLSEEQLKVARQRAAAAGVADRVKFELIDYRAMTGQFDRIVSVGMFEHVGPQHYGTFFRQCRALLSADGVMLLHTIGRMGKPGVTDPWTMKYIFPGGYNPALSEIVKASEPTRMIVTDVEILRLHYAMTLDQWFERTVAHRAEITALYDERFYRMWAFYLAGAASAFRYGGLVNFQLQYVRDRHALPITRDYMGAAEKLFAPRI
jgi:cyclopropane-fatty-acyl-phospholipid synthase